jgi:hypothetical protein
MLGFPCNQVLLKKKIKSMNSYMAPSWNCSGEVWGFGLLTLKYMNLSNTRYEIVTYRLPLTMKLINRFLNELQWKVISGRLYICGRG